MEILSLKFKMMQLPYQLSKIFTTCVSQTTGWCSHLPLKYFGTQCVCSKFIETKYPESYWDKLCSLVATYCYWHRIQQFKEEGYDFHCYMYVSEVDLTTGTLHELDHCHTLRRIWKHSTKIKCKFERFLQKYVPIVCLPCAEVCWRWCGWWNFRWITESSLNLHKF